MFVFAHTVHSQWRSNGEIAKDSSWQKSVGDFGAMLMITNDPEGLFAAWNEPPSPDYGPNIATVTSAHRGDSVMAFVVFFGCAEGDDGNCDCVVTYTAYYPNGEVYGRHSAPLWTGQPGPGADSLQLSEGLLGLKIESDDPFGNYRITADIVDKVSGAEISLLTEIGVVESE